jgi:hypothetical protein
MARNEGVCFSISDLMENSGTAKVPIDGYECVKTLKPSFKEEVIA